MCFLTLSFPAGNLLKEFLDKPVADEFHERSHEERRDDGADTDECGKTGKGVSRKCVANDAEYDNGDVGYDPHVTEFTDMPGVNYDKRHGIVGRDTEISCHVKRECNADKKDAQDKDHDPYADVRRRKQIRQDLMCKLGDVAQEKQIYDRAKTYIVAVKDEAEQKKHSINDNIKCSVSYGDESIES